MTARSRDKGLLRAWILDGQGGGRQADWKDIAGWKPEDGMLWVHLDRSVRHSREWLLHESGVPGQFVNSMLAEETRPRVRVQDSTLMLILRSINLNPGAEPDDMVQLRLFTDGHKVITLRHRRVYAVQDVEEQLENGSGPADCGEFLSRLMDIIGARIAGVVEQLQDNIDDLEETILAGETGDLRAQLADLRHQAITLRRYVTPQREALMELVRQHPAWMDERSRRLVEDVSERTTRLAEDLDASRERALVIQDELANRLNERLNHNIYRLSVIAALFLPLSFVTGLLGINVAGIPGANFGWAFVVVCALLAVVAMIQVWLFRRWDWL